MNEYRYIVSWHHPGYIGHSKIYKRRKSAFNFAIKLHFIFDEDAEIMVERQERKGETWTMTGRWMY